MHISEMQETIQKMSLVFQIKRFKLLREIQHVPTGRLVIGSQCVNSVKISDPTIADFVQLNLPRIHEKIG